MSTIFVGHYKNKPIKQSEKIEDIITGELHREDGPAMYSYSTSNPNDIKMTSWWLNRSLMTKQQFDVEVTKLKINLI